MRQHIDGDGYYTFLEWKDKGFFVKRREKGVKMITLSSTGRRCYALFYTKEQVSPIIPLHTPEDGYYSVYEWKNLGYDIKPGEVGVKMRTGTTPNGGYRYNFLYSKEQVVLSSLNATKQEDDIDLNLSEDNPFSLPLHSDGDGFLSSSEWFKLGYNVKPGEVGIKMRSGTICPSGHYNYRIYFSREQVCLSSDCTFPSRRGRNKLIYPVRSTGDGLFSKSEWKILGFSVIPGEKYILLRDSVKHTSGSPYRRFYSFSQVERNPGISDNDILVNAKQLEIVKVKNLFSDVEWKSKGFIAKKGETGTCFRFDSFTHLFYTPQQVEELPLHTSEDGAKTLINWKRGGGRVRDGEKGVLMKTQSGEYDYFYFPEQIIFESASRAARTKYPFHVEGDGFYTHKEWNSLGYRVKNGEKPTKLRVLINGNQRYRRYFTKEQVLPFTYKSHCAIQIHTPRDGLKTREEWESLGYGLLQNVTGTIMRNGKGGKCFSYYSPDQVILLSEWKTQAEWLREFFLVKRGTIGVKLRGHSMKAYLFHSSDVEPIPFKQKGDGYKITSEWQSLGYHVVPGALCTRLRTRSNRIYFYYHESQVEKD